MARKWGLVLSGVCSVALLGACAGSSDVSVCPDGLVDTFNSGMGEASICCPVGTIGQDGFCVDTPEGFNPQPTSDFPEPNTIVMEGVEPIAPEVAVSETVAEPTQSEALPETATQEPVVASSVPPIAEKAVEPTVTEAVVAKAPAAEIPAVVMPAEPIETAAPQPTADEFVYLTAPNGKGSAYCPARANSLAWNGVQYKCCGYAFTSTVVPSRDDSICCPTGTLSARWVGQTNFDYECCPAGLKEVKNEGTGDKYLCCAEGEVGKDGVCVQKTELAKEGKVLLTAVGDKGQAYCPAGANSLAWNASEFQCCGKGMKATLVPSRADSICCPDKATDARWVGKKWNDFECCPAGTVETKNNGTGDKYICCPKGNKALNGECFALK